MEGGTLLQLRNLIDRRRNVGKAKKITSHVNEIEDFIELCVQCYILAAALHFFSMSSISDSPHSNGFPFDVHKKPHKLRQKILLEKLEQLVDEYVLPCGFFSDTKKVIQHRILILLGFKQNTRIFYQLHCRAEELFHLHCHRLPQFPMLQVQSEK